MGADLLQSAIDAARWADIPLDDTQESSLELFYTWLGDEAVIAGGIGPGELDRLWTRHIADSLLFGIALADSNACLDIGSGVGLPGIPLAIARPDIIFDLVDRSGRRSDLMRRATAVLGLDNCNVMQCDASDINKKYLTIVSRAAIPPASMMIHVKHLLQPGGVAVLGLTWQEKAPEVPDSTPELAVSVITVPTDILDSHVNLLRIDAT